MTMKSHDIGNSNFHIIILLSLNTVFLYVVVVVEPYGDVITTAKETIFTTFVNNFNRKFDFVHFKGSP